MSVCRPLARRLGEVVDALVAPQGEEIARAAKEAEYAERRELRRHAPTWAARETPNGGAA